MNYPNYNPYQPQWYSPPQQSMTPVYNQPQNSYQTPYPPNQSQSFLNGKFVDGIDMVRAMDVPMGGYGIFPKADLTEIYLKSWNKDGTTSVITFKPELTTENNSGDTVSLNSIMEHIAALDSKVNTIVKNLCE